MFNNGNVFKRPNTVIQGIQAYQQLAKAWSVDVKDLYTETFHEAQQDVTAWKELKRTTGKPDVHNIVTTTSRDKWHANIEKQATATVVADLVADASGRTLETLEGRRNSALKSDEAWHHVATVLDVDTAYQDYADAVADLGDTIKDPMTAAQRNPVAFAEYMKRSPQLLYLDALTGPYERYRMAALHGDVPPLPTLLYKKDGFNHRTDLFTPEELRHHQIAGKYRSQARDDYFLTELALGAYAPITLATTLDPKVYRERLERLNNAGVSKQVNAA